MINLTEKNEPVSVLAIGLAIQIILNWLLNLGNIPRTASLLEYTLVIIPFSLAIIISVSLIADGQMDGNGLGLFLGLTAIFGIAALITHLLLTGVFDWDKIFGSGRKYYPPFYFLIRLLEVFRQYYSVVSILNLPASIWLGSLVVQKSK